ncbi:MAG: hypothetical protein IPN32_38545 [Deltaproteobacteria bacterium]|nr:hypothetical protein [Deltaproteobacteria bacterium]
MSTRKWQRWGWGERAMWILADGDAVYACVHRAARSWPGLYQWSAWLNGHACSGLAGSESDAKDAAESAVDTIADEVTS